MMGDMEAAIVGIASFVTFMFFYNFTGLIILLLMSFAYVGFIAWQAHKEAVYHEEQDEKIDLSKMIRTIESERDVS